MVQTPLPQGYQPTTLIPAPNKLPHIVTGLSEYLDFAQKRALFVDKTALLQKLVRENFVFLSRPRRFGKSILISMLKKLFQHGTQNFEGMAIHEQWQEQTYPVLTLSFLGITDPATFEYNLCRKLRRAFFQSGFYDSYNFLPDCTDFNLLLSRFVDEVLQGQKIVLLIDEWDAPLSSNLHDRERYQANTELLRQFYTWVRESGVIWFLLVTGIGRYQNTSFFTGEYITDISMDPDYAALVGYTQEDLKKYFAPYITRSAWLNHISEEEMLEQIKLYYDGFCFDQNGAVKVYSPWSINCFFRQVEKWPDLVPGFETFWMDNANAPSAISTDLKLHNPDLTFPSCVLVDL